MIEQAEIVTKSDIVPPQEVASSLAVGEGQLKQHFQERSFLARAGFEKILKSPELENKDETKIKLMLVSMEAYRRARDYARKNNVDFSKTKSEGQDDKYDLLSTDQEKVRSVAEGVHGGYVKFHKGLRHEIKAHRTDQNGNVFDLLSLNFEDLEKSYSHWAEINKLSASQLLMIAEVFGKELSLETTLDQVLENDQLLFEMNAALYDVWSDFSKKQQDLDQSGKVPNPLFTRKKYEDFKAIANKEEPTEGWENFASSYKKYLYANRETYAKLMLTTDFGTTNITDNQNQNQKDSLVGQETIGFVNSMVSIDEDKSNKIEDAEIDQLDLKKIKALVIAQAKLELLKDEEILKSLIIKSSEIQALLGIQRVSESSSEDVVAA